MATARAKHGSYIFQRAGSENYYVKLRSPTGRIEKSLGTAIRQEAEIIAGPLVTAHKAALLAARPRFGTTSESVQPCTMSATALPIATRRYCSPRSHIMRPTQHKNLEACWRKWMQDTRQV